MMTFISHLWLRQCHYIQTAVHLTIKCEWQQGKRSLWVSANVRRKGIKLSSFVVCKSILLSLKMYSPRCYQARLLFGDCVIARDSLRTCAMWLKLLSASHQRINLYNYGEPLSENPLLKYRFEQLNSFLPAYVESEIKVTCMQQRNDDWELVGE